MAETLPRAARPGQLAFRWRVSLLLTAAVGTIIANRSGIGWFPVFPEGLLQLLPAPYRWNEDDFIVLGWGLYVALIALLLYVKNRRAFFVVFALLCGLLIFNTVGCHKEFPIRL
jgi:hypothetical protein